MDCTVRPSEGALGIDDSCGVFVSTAGSDGAAGTSAAPKLTLQAAVDAAKDSAKRVYVCGGGTYDGAVTVPDGVEIYGALNCADGWKYVGGLSANLTAPSDTVVVTFEGSGRLEDLAVTSAAATVPGGSSIAVLTGSTGDITIVRSTITAGSGAAGVSPAAASAAAKGGEAGTSAIGMHFVGATATCDSDRTGGAGGTNTCDGVVTDGGAGGSAGVCVTVQGTTSCSNGVSGIAGLPAPGGTAGASATSGGAGGAGTPGGAPVGAKAGVFIASAYTPSDGEAGKPGLVGHGGGGGGGQKGQTSGCFVGGGGGGAGGCGGVGGAPGTGGGASVGILSPGASLTLIASTVNAGAGGAGGKGAAGQKGGAGGGGAIGAATTFPTTSRGSAGGNGGAGGDGGPGGGGAGGPSIGIAYAVAPTLDGGSSAKASTGGAGGLDGNGASVGKGADGASSTMTQLP